jgi:ribosomal protein S18 acetylase RimI-like enzyme
MCYKGSMSEAIMDVQTMRREDLDRVVAVFLDSYAEGWTAEQAKSYLSKFYGFEPESCLIGVEPGGRIAGAVLGYSYPRKHEVILFIQELFVHPDLRSRGWGRALVGALRGRFAENPRVNVKPLVKAPPSVHSFYNSLGFERDHAFTFYDE